MSTAPTNAANTNVANSTAANHHRGTTQPASARPQAATLPAVDIIENEAGITLVADLPGVAKERLGVKVDGDTLTIEGSTDIQVPDHLEVLHREIRHPYFRRTFTLSRELDPSKIEANLQDGVLRLRIPKSDDARPRRVEIQVA